MKKILCIGLGKLGLIFSFILASKQNFIYGYDVNRKIREDIEENKTNSEPKLNDLIRKFSKNFNFEENFNVSVNKTSCAFIIVPTPSKKK